MPLSFTLAGVNSFRFWKNLIISKFEKYVEILTDVFGDEASLIGEKILGEIEGEFKLPLFRKIKRSEQMWSH